MPALAVSHLTVTLPMISNNRRSFSSTFAVHVRFILQQVFFCLDEELKHDVTYWMIAAIFRPFCDRNSNYRLLDLSASER
jgi:hypothetical protein